MKISSDYSINFSGLTNNINKRITNNATKTINQITPSENRQKIRELSSAMIMIQKARYIVQQALTVSRQINNLATVTIQTGKIDPDKFSQELAQVNASLDEYGMEVISTNLPENKTMFVTKEEFSEIKKQTTKIERQVNSKKVNYEEIDQSIGILKKVESGFLKKQDRIFEEFNRIAKVKKNDFQSLIKSISSQSIKAHTAQGNINPQKVFSII